MKALVLGMAFAVTLSCDAFGAGSAWVLQQGAHLCLRSDHIQHNKIIDNKTILFRMDDGTEWKNTLQHMCAGLNLAGGFEITLRGNYICSNQQPIRIIGAGNTCYLGDFAQAPAAP